MSSSLPFSCSVASLFGDVGVSLEAAVFDSSSSSSEDSVDLILPTAPRPLTFFASGFCSGEMSLSSFCAGVDADWMSGTLLVGVIESAVIFLGGFAFSVSGFATLCILLATEYG